MADPDTSFSVYFNTPNWVGPLCAGTLSEQDTDERPSLAAWAFLPRPPPSPFPGSAQDPGGVKGQGRHSEDRVCLPLVWFLLVPKGCHNQVPQTKLPTTIKCIVSGFGKLEVTCQVTAGCALSDAPGRTLLSFPALAFAGNPWHCLAWGCLTPVTWSPFPCVFPLCMSASMSTYPPFYSDTIYRIRAHLISAWLLWKDPP